MDDRVLVVKMVAYIEENLAEPIHAEGLALRSGYSLNRFRQKFFNVTGDTPSGYLRKRRLTEAAKEILAGAQIADVALKYGYSSQDNFTTAFRSFFGVTPAEIARIDGKYKRFIRTMREAYSIMEIANLKQPPLSTTLMGCIKGASDYFDNDLSTAMLFGLTGHAFLINISDTLCPSSPYVWKTDRFFQLLEGLGIKVKEKLQVTRGAAAADLQTMEKKLKTHMEEGDLFILNFLENQLVAGYDEKSFVVLRPWNGVSPAEVPTLTFGTWSECLEREGWAAFTVLTRSPRSRDVKEAAKSALEYALETYTTDRWQEKGYRMGLAAYDAWADCLKKGMGSSQGNWWCSMVWTECRWSAADFFRELSELVEGGEEACVKLALAYKAVAESLAKVGRKDLGDAEKLTHLETARQRETEAVEGIKTLLASGLLG